MSEMNQDAIENDYRSAPRRPGVAHDEQAIGRMNLKNDQVSVVHSGETDTMPNQEPQEAIADDDSEVRAEGASQSGDQLDAEEVMSAGENLEDHNPGADAITAIDDPNLELVGDVDEVTAGQAMSGNPENPTAATGADVEDDDNDFEYQQQLGEGSGPVGQERDADDAEGREEVA